MAVMIETAAEKRERIEILDLLRGFAMILVMLYHLLYDLKFLYHADIPPIITPGQREFEIFHTGFLWILFAVSGICLGYSRDPVKRGAVLYIVGWLITFFTSCFMPDMLIVFGVLSCFGACMVITGLIKPVLDKIPWQALLAVSLVMWLITRNFASTGELDLIFVKIPIPMPEMRDYLYPMGIIHNRFYSMDYFPVIPYIFMFLTGYALHRPVSQHKLPDFFYRVKSGAIGFIGRHSLVFYAIHQPLMILILNLIY